MTVLDALHILNAIKDTKKRLTQFEKDFCHSMVKSCAIGKPISKSQGKWLEEIYKRCAGGGQYATKQYIA